MANLKALAMCASLGLALLSSSVRAEPLPDVRVPGAEPTETLEFPCGELRCRGSLFLPEELSPDQVRPDDRGDQSSGGRQPLIVMAHGLTLTREYLALQASAFARAGFAVFTFDYRGFGGSEGSPRFDVSAERQLEDWRAAIAFIRERKQIDPTRIGLWGSSYSGGHVLVLASEAPGIRAVVAQVPYVGASVEESRGAFFMAKAIGALSLDGFLRLFGGAYYVAVAGAPGELAGITIAEESESLDRFIASVPDSNWRNRMPARSLYRVGTYVPDIRPEQIRCPVSLYAARSDRITPGEAIAGIASRIARAELHRVDGGHFDIYAEPQLSNVIAEEIEFYRRHLTSDEAAPDDASGKSAAAP